MNTQDGLTTVRAHGPNWPPEAFTGQRECLSVGENQLATARPIRFQSGNSGMGPRVYNFRPDAEKAASTKSPAPIRRFSLTFRRPATCSPQRTDNFPISLKFESPFAGSS